jgi:hypothetical protein
MKNKFISSASGKTIKYEDTRTGKTNKLIDSKRTALLSGKRISKNNKIYYEKRQNRSDLYNTKI